MKKSAFKLLLLIPTILLENIWPIIFRLILLKQFRFKIGIPTIQAEINHPTIGEFIGSDFKFNEGEKAGNF